MTPPTRGEILDPIQYDDQGEENDGYAKVRCPTCGYTLLYFVARIGTLGSIDHLKCRHCDTLWSVER